MFLALMLCELRKLQRAPAFTVPTLLFPILFFALFGLAPTGGRIAGAPAAPYLLASFASFSVMSTALFPFGVSIASERRAGWHRLLRISPIPPALYLLAKLAVACLFTVLAIVLLVTFARLTVDGIAADLIWRLPLHLLVGVLPFAALGLMLGLLCAPNAASAIANLIFLPLAFGSGLFVPLERLPEAVRDVAIVLPSYHIGLIAWSLVGAAPRAAPAVSAVLLILFATLVLLLALQIYRHGTDDIR